MKPFQRTANDTGSPEVQIAILTSEINELSEHLQKNPNDVNSRKGLFLKVSNRTRLLKYLKRTDLAKYEDVIKRLGLRK
ncbi:MAG: 30S ribosomal protein S15 [Dongiaceae bacterium]